MSSWHIDYPLGNEKIFSNSEFTFRKFLVNSEMRFHRIDYIPEKC